MAEGLCDICGNSGILQSCMLCGKRICQGCFIPEKRVCKFCIGGMKFR